MISKEVELDIINKFNEYIEMAKHSEISLYQIIKSDYPQVDFFDIENLWFGHFNRRYYNVI